MACAKVTVDLRKSSINVSYTQCQNYQNGNEDRIRELSERKKISPAPRGTGKVKS